MDDETGDGGGGDGGGKAGGTEVLERPRDHRVHFVTDSGRTWLSRCDDRWPATVANAAAMILSVAVAWCLLRVNVTPALMAVPGGSVASMFVLYVAGAAAGRAAGLIPGVPPLLGMMLAGIALQNCGLYSVTDEWCVELVAIMRYAFHLEK